MEYHYRRLPFCSSRRGHQVSQIIFGFTPKNMNYRKNLYGNDHWDSQFRIQSDEGIRQGQRSIHGRFMQTMRNKEASDVMAELNVDAMAKPRRAHWRCKFNLLFRAYPSNSHDDGGYLYPTYPLGENDTVFESGPKRDQGEAVLQKALTLF
jgi:hypothetical protein